MLVDVNETIDDLTKELPTDDVRQTSCFVHVVICFTVGCKLHHDVVAIFLRLSVLVNDLTVSRSVNVANIFVLHS